MGGAGSAAARLEVTGSWPGEEGVRMALLEEPILIMEARERHNQHTIHHCRISVNLTNKHDAAQAHWDQPEPQETACKQSMGNTEKLTTMSCCHYACVKAKLCP